MTLLLGLDHSYLGVLSLLEALVLTIVAAPAISDTLHLSRAVDAVGILPAGSIAAGDGVLGKEVNLPVKNGYPKYVMKFHRNSIAERGIRMSIGRLRVRGKRRA